MSLLARSCTDQVVPLNGLEVNGFSFSAGRGHPARRRKISAGTKPSDSVKVKLDLSPDCTGSARASRPHVEEVLRK
jgi:hypothetical protein